MPNLRTAAERPESQEVIMTHTIIFFGGILLALVLGTRLKINIGLAAAAVAFPVGILAGGGDVCRGSGILVSYNSVF